MERMKHLSPEDRAAMLARIEETVLSMVDGLRTTVTDSLATRHEELEAQFATLHELAFENRGKIRELETDGQHKDRQIEELKNRCYDLERFSHEPG